MRYLSFCNIFFPSGMKTITKKMLSITVSHTCNPTLGKSEHFQREGEILKGTAIISRSIFGSSHIKATASAINERF